MKTEHALRHLLLRHFKIFEDAVPEKRFLEIAQSLRVEAQGRTAYLVVYRDSGKQHQHGFPFDAFEFYGRGDTRPEHRGLNDDLGNLNDARALKFAEEVFGVAFESLPVRPVEPLDAYRRFAIAEMVAFAAATAWAASLDPMASVALFSLVLAEFTHRGRLISSALFGCVAFTGPATAALIAAGAYGLLQFLDPNPERRHLRVGLCLLAVALAGFRIGFSDVNSVWDLPAIGALILAAPLSALRSFYSSHFRALPLALPFFCAGLVADSHVTAASMGFTILGLGSALSAFGHRCSPIQRSGGRRRT